MPEGAHPLPEIPAWELEVINKDYCRRHPEDAPARPGWEGMDFVEMDGDNWPLSFAAGILDIPLRDLQDLVRITGLQPAGVIRMASFRRQGRQPRAYPAGKLIRIAEAARSLREELAEVKTSPTA